MRLDEEFILVRLWRRTKLESSSRRIMRLVAVFILDEFNRRRKTRRITWETHNSSGRIMRL